ncbi:gfo/Idh/MocA family oxidoreductase [candidate division KSB1 bacterium]|nr:gfo/Idh/MocA family oxidoreductase [candidate division KSB1 bacterium]
MKEIKWGFIGCGDVTEVKSGPAFSRIPGSSVEIVMRRNGEKARDYAARHNIPNWTANADEVIHNPDVNAIYIATPPSSHAEYTIRAAAAGKPVYVEKPMARNYAECQEMISACKKANVPLFVAYYRRRLEPFVKVRELVQQEAIGKILFVNIRLFMSPRPVDFDSEHLPWRVLPDIAGGGYFIDMGSHQLDYLDYLFGPVISAKGVAENRGGLYPAEDTVSASLLFESGVVANGAWCFAVPEQSEVDSIEIIGSHGKIEFSTFEKSPINVTTSEGTERYTVEWSQHVQQPLIETVVAELQGKGNCPSTGESASRTNRVIDDIFRDFRAQNFND